MAHFLVEIHVYTSSSDLLKVRERVKVGMKVRVRVRARISVRLSARMRVGVRVSQSEIEIDS